MSKYFIAPTLPKLQAFKKIYGLEMGKKTVQEFFESIMRHTRELHIAEDQLLALFVGGLTPIVQEHVLNKEPTTLDDALHLAKQKELMGSINEGQDLTLFRKFLAQHKKEPSQVAELSAI